jgi:two-component system response regulator DesR
VIEASVGFFYYNLIKCEMTGVLPAFYEVVELRILIADDQAEVRYALRALLEQEDGSFEFEEAGDICSLFLKFENVKPDLLLLDWELSNNSMAEAITRIRKLVPGISIVALSTRPEAEKSAAAAGVDAFVSKGDNSDRLLSTVYSLR